MTAHEWQNPPTPSGFVTEPPHGELPSPGADPYRGQSVAPVSARPPAQREDLDATAARRQKVAIRAALSTWLLVTVITNIVWIATAVGLGHFYYYWPIWPMLGTAIPFIIAWASAVSEKAANRIVGD